MTKGARGLFYDTRDLLRVIRSTYNPLVRTAEMDILRPVMEADLLVLDDLGSEKTSEWVEETMNLIVNTRYNERRHTIFTSNYEDTPDEDSDDPDFTLKARIGFRIHSRLHEMCEFLEFDGADFRHAASQRRRRRPADDVEGEAPRRTLPARARRAGPRPAQARRVRQAGGTTKRELAGLEARPGQNSNPAPPDARPLPPHPVLLGHLQLLQLQPGPLRRGLKDRYVARPGRARSGERPTASARRHDFLRRRNAVAARAGGDRAAHRRLPRRRSLSRRTPKSRSRPIPRPSSRRAGSAGSATPVSIASASVSSRSGRGAAAARPDPLGRARAARRCRGPGRRVRQRQSGPDDVAAGADAGGLAGERRGADRRSSPTTRRCTCWSCIPTRRSKKTMARAAGRWRPTTMRRRCTCASLERLEAAGYRQYEISNVARAGPRVAAQPQVLDRRRVARVRVRRALDAWRVRWKNVSGTEDYIGARHGRRAAAASNAPPVPRRNGRGGALFTGLRLADGVDVARRRRALRRRRLGAFGAALEPSSRRDGLREGTGSGSPGRACWLPTKSWLFSCEPRHVRLRAYGRVSAFRRVAVVQAGTGEVSRRMSLEPRASSARGRARLTYRVVIALIRRS